MHVNVFDFSQLLAQSTERYLEFVRVSSLSVGIYVLDSGALDPQKPHSEDEVYYVASGSGSQFSCSSPQPRVRLNGCLELSFDLFRR